MAKVIFWNRRALNKFESILIYLEETFSEKTAENFARVVHQKLIILSKNPEMGRLSQKDLSVRYISISKYNLLYYRIRENKLVVLTFFDTRQAPGKRPY